MDVHSPFTEFLHYEANQQVLPYWLKIIHLDNSVGRWLTIPIAAFYLVAIPVSWKRKKFGALEVLMIGIGIWVDVTWLINVAYDPRVITQH